METRPSTSVPDPSRPNVTVGSHAPTAAAHTARVPRGKSAEYLSADSARTGLSADSLKQGFVEHLLLGLGRAPAVATRHDAYTALALTVRDRVLRRAAQTSRRPRKKTRAWSVTFRRNFSPARTSPTTS